MKPAYSIPKLVKYDDLKKTWYVYFRYNGKVIKFTKDINRLKSKKERIFYGEALAKATLQRLKEGWIPVGLEPAVPEAKSMNLYQALLFAMDKKQPDLAPKTFADYNCTIRFCKDALNSLNMAMLPIKEVKRVHIKTILENIKTSRKWSNKAYNKGLHHIQAILSELLQWDILEDNPAHKIKPLPVEDTFANRPPTPDEHTKIKAELEKNHPYYMVFMATLHDTGIRPVELTRITLSMIDVNKRLIFMPARITKNRKKPRTVQISNALWPYLAMYVTPGFPEDWYLFGSDRISGRGNEGSFEDFIPGPTQLKRDTSTTRWRRIVKLGLGIDVNQYAYKHFGADNKYRAGIDIEAISNMFGHQSVDTTRIYARAVQGQYFNQIKENSPGF